MVAVDGAEDALDDVLAAAEEALSTKAAPAAAVRRGRARRPRTLAEAVRRTSAGRPRRDLDPGPLAAAEALKALRLGLNAFVFSDNVPLEQEIALKREAHERGLIVMGPDCGTGIVGGVPLGFANEVRAGDIGLIGALRHRPAAGLEPDRRLGRGREPGHRRRRPRPRRRGRRDLDARCPRRARRRPATKVLGLVSKPPDPEVAERVLGRAAASGKPVVAAFLGADPAARPTA